MIHRLPFKRDIQYARFCAYGFLKNLRFFDPFLVLFFLEKGLSFFQIGVLIALREVVRNIFEVPSGIISDVWGRRRTLVISFACYIVSFGVFFVSQNYGVMLLAMGCYAFGDAFRSGTHKAMILEYLQQKGWMAHKAAYYGHTRSWSQMGSAVSSLLAAAVVLWQGSYRWVFLWSVIPYVLDLVLMLTYPASLDGERVPVRRAALRAAFGRVLNDFVHTFRHGATLRVMINMSLFSGYHKAVKDYLQPVLQSMALAMPLLLLWEDKQRSAMLVGVVYFALYMLTAGAARHAGTLQRWLHGDGRAMDVTLLGGLLLGLLSGVCYHMGWTVMAVVLFVMLYLIENVRKPIGVSRLAAHMPRNIMATVLSAESQTQSLLAAVVAPLTGWLADMMGIGLALAAVSALLILPGLVMVRED